MRLCPQCGGSGRLLKMGGHKIGFVRCYPCGGNGTIYPAPPLVDHVVIKRGAP